VRCICLISTGCGCGYAHNAAQGGAWLQLYRFPTTSRQLTSHRFQLCFIAYATDDGEGHVGTVCEIGRCGSTHSPENTVVVNWDSGHRTNYRVGYQNQYDLIIVDNAQVGK